MSGLTFTLPEAAAELGVSEDWLKREASAGRVPSRKIGRSRRFTQQDLDDYLESVRFVAADPLAQSTASRARRRRTA
jgi:excisionase family DNA binding protein